MSGKIHCHDVVRSTFRNWKKLDLNVFRQRVLASSVVTNPASTADSFASQLEADITDILDDLAPVCTSTKRRGKADARWLSAEAVAAKQERRRLERRWKASKLETVRTVYRAACRAANKLINESRRAFCASRVTESSHDPRKLRQTVKGLLHPGHSTANHQPGLSSTFETYFVSKIAKVKSTVSVLRAQRAMNLSRPCSEPAHRRPHT